METWREIPGFEGFYEVSDEGRVRSVGRVVFVAPSAKAPNGYRREIKGRVLRPCPSSGYRSFSLWRGHEVAVRRGGALVLLAFGGQRPAGLYVCHRDGNRANDRLENLYYGTPSENTEDARRHGTMRVGERSPHAKLKASDVSAIRGMAGRLSQSQIARQFSVSQAQVSRIIGGHKWGMA